MTYGDPEPTNAEVWAMESLLLRHMTKGRLGFKGADRWVIRALLDAKEEGRREASDEFAEEHPELPPPPPPEAKVYPYAECLKCGTIGAIDWDKDEGKDPFYFSAARTVHCASRKGCELTIEVVLLRGEDATAGVPQTGPLDG